MSWSASTFWLVVRRLQFHTRRLLFKSRRRWFRNLTALQTDRPSGDDRGRFQSVTQREGLSVGNLVPWVVCMVFSLHTRLMRSLQRLKRQLSPPSSFMLSSLLFLSFVSTFFSFASGQNNNKQKKSSTWSWTNSFGAVGNVLPGWLWGKRQRQKTFFEGLRVLDGKRHRFRRVQRSQFIQGAWLIVFEREWCCCDKGKSNNIIRNRWARCRRGSWKKLPPVPSDWWGAAVERWFKPEKTRTM